MAMTIEGLYLHASLARFMMICLSFNVWIGILELRETNVILLSVSQLLLAHI